MSIKILRGDCREVLRTMPDESVHMVCTSPPYWGLRDYGTATWEGGNAGCSHKQGRDGAFSADGGMPGGRNRDGIAAVTRDTCRCGARRIDSQLGLEPTYQEYVANMVEVFREVRRVLRKDGTLWLNLGDSYTSGGRTQQVAPTLRTNGRDAASGKQAYLNNFCVRPGSPEGLKPKDLIGIPWRVAFALQADGWYLRQDIIWSKPNPMPESVRDRCTKAHEYLFLLSKSERYYYDQDAIREPFIYAGDVRINTAYAEATGKKPTREYRALLDTDGRNKRSVWEIATAPFSEAHFACVDAETECLTEHGWVRHNALAVGTRAGQFDLASGRLSWAPITEIARYAVTDQVMVRASTRSLDMLLTPNHRCVVQRRHPRLRHYQDPVIVRADELKSSHAVPTTAPWDFVGDASLPVEWAELLGWYIAEGHEAKQTLAVEIYQSETVNPTKVQRIEQLLRQVGAEWTSARYEREWRGRPAVGVAFRVQGYAAARLRELSPSKRIPHGALLWANEQIAALLKGLVEGDGHERSDGRSCFIQKSPETAGMVQALAVRLGLSALLSTRPDGCCVVYITKHHYRSFRGTAGVGTPPRRENYTGTVWCPRLPNGTWVARRNGRVFITGNTFPPALIEPCIMAGTSEKGCCAKCGAPWVRNLEHRDQPNEIAPRGKHAKLDETGIHHGQNGRRGVAGSFSNNPALRPPARATIGWSPSCYCARADADGADFPLGKCTVLDPFGGAGTTGLVADRLGRNAILIELNAEYADMAERRLKDDAGMFAEVF